MCVEAVSMEWNLCQFLPGAVRDAFTSAVAGFVAAAHAQPQELRALLRGDMAQKLFQ